MSASSQKSLHTIGSESVRHDLHGRATDEARRLGWTCRAACPAVTSPGCPLGDGREVSDHHASWVCTSGHGPHSRQSGLPM